MKKILVFIIFCSVFTCTANAFSNSLDGSAQDQSFPQNNNFSNKSPSKSNFNQSFTPKEHTGFQHTDGQYSNPEMNDTRYNSNCQFGQCIPGGMAPNNR
ncbi:MAG: hypothetical protein K6E29_06650 [Cyanobacteria bacterium RUI128]|nr:hypothetical protein [Cyanobacteria bacterium RUI128]